MGIQFLQQLGLDDQTGVLWDAVGDKVLLAGLNNAQSLGIQALVSDAGVLFSALPAASGTQRFVLVSDIGPRGTFWRSDGTDWAPLGGVCLLARAVDFGGNRTVTGTTSETSVYTYSVPANVMGQNGALRISLRFNHTNNANIKTLRVKFGNSSPMVFSATPTATISETGIIHIQNQGATNAQDAHGSIVASLGGTTAADVTGAFDTTVAQLLEVTIQLAVGTDTAALKRIHVELVRF